jgi:hypothetical protein
MTTETEKTKRCTKCNQDRPVSLFTKRSLSRDGLNYWCKPCWLGIELEPEKPEPEPEPDEPVIEFSELKAFAKRFILDHLDEHGEAVDEFFRHRLPYDHPEVTREAVERAISELIKEAKVKVTRWETAGMYERVNFLALA